MQFPFAEFEKHKKSLDFSTRVLLVTSLILSNIDYCNIVLLTATDKDLRPIKLVMNKAIRFIFNLKYRTHVTPYYKQVHFLPIKCRIKYKACLIGFKIFNNISPQYLRDDFEIFTVRQHMQSRRGVGRDNFMFCLNHDDTKSHQLTHCIKKEWNALPLDLRTCPSLPLFKAKLKTFIFEREYC